MYDLATAAVEAAVNAGARYADARAMEMRSEAMAARNGVVESLDREQRAGIGVRALIGSSWGFFAVPEASPATARQAGEQAAAVNETVHELAGEDVLREMDHPIMGAEDFSYVLQRVSGTFAFVGARPAHEDPLTAPQNHSNRVVFDEEPMALGAALYAALAVRTLDG